jgi:hypothetical protein
MEVAVATLLEQNFPVLMGATPLSGAHVGTVLPFPFKADLTPYVRISDLGGSEENIVTMVSPLEVDVYDVTRDGAYDLSEGIRAKLVGSPHRIGEARIDKVTVVSKPTLAEWPDNDIRRFIATYRVSLRRLTEKR